MSTGNEVAVVTFSEMEKLAQAVASSGLFGFKTKEQALSLMAIAQAEGMHPASAAMQYDIIQGKPTLKSEAMLSRFLRTGGKVEWHAYDDEKASGTFSHPLGGTVRIDWDMQRAKQAGLDKKDMWIKWPRNMLRARVISEAIRMVNPGSTNNFYTPDEVEEFDDASSQNSSHSSRGISNKNGSAQLPSMPPDEKIIDVSKHETAGESGNGLLDGQINMVPFGESLEDKKAIFEEAKMVSKLYDIDSQKNDSLIKSICRTVLTKNPTKETINKEITQLFYDVKKHRPEEINT